MTKIDWKRKLSSRKLWVAAAGIVTGLVVFFGGNAGAVTDVAGAVVAVCSALSYIIVEGKVDAAALSSAAQKVEIATETLIEVEE